MASPRNEPSSDDEGRFSLSSTPTAGPSVPLRHPQPMVRSSSAVSRTGSYFPPSPSVRPTSPIPHHRVSHSTARSYRSPSGARDHRSTSVSTVGRPLDDAADVTDDEDEGNNSTPPAEPAVAEDVAQRDRDREFTEDDPLTLKDRQSLINVEHPFGLRIWKPALYKKSRTVTRDAETEVHSVPTGSIDRHFIPGNVLWTIFFGWWLALVALLVSTVLWLVPYGGHRYARVALGLGWYIFWPFGNYVEGDIDDNDKENEEEAGNGEAVPTPRGPQPSIPESAQETDIDPDAASVPLTSHSTVSTITPARLHTQTLSWNSDPASVTERTSLRAGGRAKAYGIFDPDTPAESAAASIWLGRIVFWLLLICILAPLLLIVTLICWALVITIPMAKLNWELLHHLFQRPLHIRFCAAPPPTVVEADESYTFRRTRLSAGQAAPHTPRSTVLLCTYRALGLRYYKYTVGGVNILFINLIPVVFFVIFDGLFLLPLAERKPLNGIPGFFASRALVFTLALLSVIPLSYFIGMAVASISAQSSIGMGAVINATFGSIIEVILYAIMLTQGKGALVEGSIVGSILAGVLLMPGLSMCGGALRKKEQKFNAKSAGVTSTMLIMAIIGVLTPTMFYQVYGNFQLVCDGCPSGASTDSPWRCTHCYYEHPDPTSDPFYQSTVKEFMYFCAGILLFSYLIGLWFSLRTHATQIWQNPQQLMHPLDLPQHPNSRMSLYHRLVQANVAGGMMGLPTHYRGVQRKASTATTVGSGGAGGGGSGGARAVSPSVTRRPSSAQALSQQSPAQPQGQTQAQTPNPTAAQTPGATQVPFTPIMESVNHAVKSAQAQPLPPNLTTDDFTRAVAVATVSALRHQHDGQAQAHGGQSGGHGGHEGPSWSRGLSASVLLACTFLYAIIAEILVEVVDVVLEGSGVQEKFLGITLFALVPNTTEFMNAISFAINGNIALSMEIGSAYALQVCLLQIPAMVAFSAWYGPGHVGRGASTFTLLFPRWDVIAIILSIFLLTYTYIEAKANYHRGSILVLSYVVLAAGFYYAPPLTGEIDRTVFRGTPEGPKASLLTAIRTYLFSR